MPAHTLMFVELSDCDLIKNSTEHAPRMSLLRLTICIYAYQGVTKRFRPSWLGRRFFYLKLADTIARYKNRNLKPRNRIGRLKNRNSKRTDTIGRYKNRNLRPRNRIGRLKNRNSKRTDTIGRFKNRNLTSTDCIVRYNRKIESVSEDRSIGPFAHLW